ncbi:putative hexose phosphate transport protein [Gracilariopsis chorda]|uniref:Putative hexose phosphate transport protein n=1 Tax=Gracilariopsis chorda TaxID=448386 RepID=A0A2V3IKK0_9FLOR|nr:putative hexose phosphate transport protein [Gracilariopsis chorda]|eukprot:PXF42591.1 putative hexose phosphate transport protein [Gracilariopsis chorda]
MPIPPKQAAFLSPAVFGVQSYAGPIAPSSQSEWIPKFAVPHRGPRCTPRLPSALHSKLRMAAVGAGQKSENRSDKADELVQRKYVHWRIRIFYSIFMGYASFYLTRNSFIYVAPSLRQALGFSLEQLGIIMSVFPLAYGFSKLAAGILSDRFSTRVFMSVGLAITGVINILFGFQTRLYAFVALWLANGFFQAAGAPPCAKLLTTWYSRSERGTWWGFWNTSHNTGGFLIPLLAGYCARAFGWQYGMIVPGVISIAMGFFLFNRLRDNPEAVGLPPVDEPENNTSGATTEEIKNEDTLTSREKLFKHVLSNPYVWLLAVSYFFVYFVRQGVSSWAHIFLLDYKGVADAQEAAFRVSGMEIGGLLGSLVSGWASDKMMRGRRIPIIVLWLLGVMGSVAGLWFVPVAWRYVNWLSVFCIGFFIYGPQMLVGLAGAEIVDKSAVSSTIGLLGWIAYLGAAVSGYPLTRIVSKLGWGAYFTSLIGFAGIAVLLLLPMWRLGMGAKTKPIPKVPAVRPVVPAVAGAGAGVGGLVTVPTTVSFVTCSTCAGTGSIMRLECGPATPSQTLSCKYLETQCPWCGGSGYLQEAGG